MTLGRIVDCSLVIQKIVASSVSAAGVSCGWRLLWRVLSGLRLAFLPNLVCAAFNTNISPGYIVNRPYVLS